MKEKIVNIIGIIVPVILLIVLSGSLMKNIKRSSEAKKVIQKTQEKLEKVEKENISLEEQLEITQSEEFIERQLRDKLGLAREGEIILVLPDEETLKKLAPDIPEEEKIEPLPNWKKWMELFL